LQLTDVAEKGLDLDCSASIPWRQRTLKRCGGSLLSSADLQTAQANCRSCHSQSKHSLIGKVINKEGGKWENSKDKNGHDGQQEERVHITH